MHFTECHSRLSLEWSTSIVVLAVCLWMSGYVCVSFCHNFNTIVLTIINFGKHGDVWASSLR